MTEFVVVLVFCREFSCHYFLLNAKNAVFGHFGHFGHFMTTKNPWQNIHNSRFCQHMISYGYSVMDFFFIIVCHGYWVSNSIKKCCFVYFLHSDEMLNNSIFLRNIVKLSEMCSLHIQRSYGSDLDNVEMIAKIMKPDEMNKSGRYWPSTRKKNQEPNSSNLYSSSGKTLKN